MASNVELAIVIGATDHSSAVLGNVQGKLGQLEGSTDKVSKATAAMGVASRIAAGVLATGLVGALSDAANAAANDEASVLKLQRAVENSGVSWDASRVAIEARIVAGEKLAFTDDQVRDSLALLTAQTGSVEEALKRQVLAMDLARGANIPLETASKLLGKVTEENVNVLNRYGIVVKQGSTETELFAAVQQKFGGQAEVYGNSTAGSIFKVKNSIDEWKESIGASLGPAQGLIALLPGLQSGMMLTGGAAGALSSLMKTTMITSFLATHPVIAATVIALGPIILIAAAIGVAILALKFAWENNLGDIQGKTQAVFAVIGEVFENIGGVLAVAAAAFGEFGAAVGGALNETLAVVGDAMGAIGEAIGNGIEAALDFARGAIGGFIRIGEDMVRGIGDGIGRMWGWVMGRVRELINLIPQAVRDLLGISSPSRVFAAIGGEIATGLVDGIEAGIPAAEAAGEAISRGVAAGITRATPEALAAMNAQIAALDAAQTGFLDRSGKRHATLKSLWGVKDDYGKGSPGANAQAWLDDQNERIWQTHRQKVDALTGQDRVAGEQYYADLYAAHAASQGLNLDSMDKMFAYAAKEALAGSVAPLAYGAVPSVANQWGLNYTDPSGALVGPTTQSGTATPWYTPGGGYTPLPANITTVVNLDGQQIATAVGTYYTEESRLAGGSL